jgi:hypothetical protein
MAYEEIDKLEIPITKLRWGLRGTQILLASFNIYSSHWMEHFSDGLLSVFFLSSIFLSSFFATAIVGVPHLHILQREHSNVIM